MKVSGLSLVLSANSEILIFPRDTLCISNDAIANQKCVEQPYEMVRFMILPSLVGFGFKVKGIIKSEQRNHFQLP